MTDLYCNENQLTSLDVSSNTALTELRCNNNQLTSLDVNKNIALENLDCSTNKLTSLDMRNNIKLTSLNCKSNDLTDNLLDIRNGKNDILINFDATLNPKLKCIRTSDSSVPNNSLKN